MSHAVDAPDFYALWEVSNFGAYASLAPPFSWDPQSSGWLAGEIRGTRSEDILSTKTFGPIQQMQQVDESAANTIIFSNLDRTSTERYLVGTGLPIYGNNVLFEPEVWEALPFTPKTDVHVKTVGAAIAYLSGTRKVNIGIYGDNGGVPGAVLPGGQLSTTGIPDSGDCCDLARVRFSGSGIPLSKGIQYWVVASPDNVNAPDFKGVWQGATISLSAYQEPEEFNNWTLFDGDWLAAEIRGTNP